MALLDALSQPVWQRLTWTLLHFLWQGLAVAAVMTVVLWLFQARHAKTRYALCLVALLVMAACPLVTFALLPGAAPSERTPVPPRAARTADEVIPEPAEGEAAPVLGHATEDPPLEAIASTASGPPVTPAIVEEAQASPAPTPWRARVSPYLRAAQPYSLVVWMGGVLLLSARLMLSFAGVRWLARRRHPTSAELAASVARLARRLGLSTNPRVFSSERIRAAMVMGLWRPTVLVPLSWLSEMTPDVLEAVIAHELAHIRRWDVWVNLLQRLVEALLFYHPAVWWLSHRLSLEREMCADELAVTATGERTTYVTALELLGRNRLNLATAQIGAAMGGRKMALLSRVRNVLGVSPAPERARWWLGGLLALLIPTAMLFAVTTGLLAGPGPSAPERGPARAPAAALDAQQPGETPAPPAPGNCSLAGRVLDAQGAGVAGAYVIICDQQSGIPLDQGTFQLFTDRLLTPRAHPTDVAHAVTDEKGRFRFQRLPAGEYRLVAQSWKDARPAEEILGMMSRAIHLRGVADHLRLSPESSPDVVLRPLGTGVLRIDDNTDEFDEHYGDRADERIKIKNTASFVAISTSPLRGDSILGFPAWGGAFARNLIGAGRKLPGKATIYGLPEGKVYVALGAWADQDTGYGAGEAVIRPATPADLKIPLIARWAKNRFRPPQRLMPLIGAMDGFNRAFKEYHPGHYMRVTMNCNGISLQPEPSGVDYVWHHYDQIARHMQREVGLPQGGTATFGDVVAAYLYINALEQQKERAEKRPKDRATPEAPESGP